MIYRGWLADTLKININGALQNISRQLDEKRPAAISSRFIFSHITQLKTCHLSFLYCVF